MKLFKNLAEAVVSALQTVFEQNVKSDRVVDRLFSTNRKWGARDRRFVAKYIYESVRWYRLYYEVGLGHEPQNVNDWWTFLGTALVLDGIELPEWFEFDLVNIEQVHKKNSEVHTKRVIYCSIPDWLDELGANEFGEKLWTETIEALNKPAQTVLRTNTIKTNRAKLLMNLDRLGISVEALGALDAVLLEESKNLTILQPYKEGLFEIQDYSSQQIVPFLNPESGSVVIDACAGAGGKSLHLAAWMQNRGFIKAMDVEDYKLKELVKRAKRASAHIITTQKIGKKAQIPLSWQEQADYLLLDVPCSGTGVIRRNPDAKWKLSPEFIEEIILVQRHILKEYSKMLKPGGKMLYATCSILKKENENQVEWFLKETDIGMNFEFIKDKRIMPQDEGFDGFYMAVLHKKL